MSPGFPAIITSLFSSSPRNADSLQEAPHQPFEEKQLSLSKPTSSLAFGSLRVEVKRAGGNGVVPQALGN